MKIGAFFLWGYNFAKVLNFGKVRSGYYSTST